MVKPSSDLSCISCDFSSFCSIEDHDTVKHFRTFKRNEIVYRANDKFFNLYAIKKGVIKSFQIDTEGNELIRKFNFRGEILGYEAIHNRHFPFSAIALCETTVCEIPYENFFNMIQTRPALMEHLLHLISEQLTAGSYLDMNTAEQRLASFILDLIARLRSTNTSELVLPMTRQDIGNYLRLATETVSRIFSRLQKNKILKIDHKNIRILKHHKLMEIADVASNKTRNNTHADL